MPIADDMAREGLMDEGAGNAGDDFMQPPALVISNVSKRFRTHLGPWGRLSSALWPSRPRGGEFWALRDIDLTIHRGECFGIVGKNGSGKSTLLKLITGALYPTHGTITTHGRVLALLELGAGLNPELTARQNVIHAASMLGMPPNYGNENMAAIEEFADIGPYFDRPMKFFSSGMFVRVAFALYMFLDPDILIVDEALSVGDVFFQQKCAAALRRLMDKGTTILLVSHDTGSVRALCDRAALMNDGRCLTVGDPSEIVNLYHATLSQSPADGIIAAAKDQPETAWRERVKSESLLTGDHRTTNGKMEILGCRVVGSNNRSTTVFRSRDTISIQLSVKANAPISQPAIGFALTDRFDSLVFATSNLNLGHDFKPMQAGDVLDLEFEVNLNLSPKDYVLMVNAADKAGSDAPNSGAFHDQHDKLGPITVFWESSLLPFYGVAELPTKVNDKTGVTD